jgi:hypothetical protein
MTTPLEERLYAGDRAREVLENEVFTQVFADIESDLIESWRNIPASDTEHHLRSRERIHLSLTLLGKVKACIVQTLETGKLAKLELEHKRSMSERLKGAIFHDE